MRIQPTTKLNFGITTKPPIKKYYMHDCYNEVSEGAFKDYSFTLYNTFEHGKKTGTMILVKKAGKWLKSRLKYMVGDKRKVLWSYAKND